MLEALVRLSYFDLANLLVENLIVEFFRAALIKVVIDFSLRLHHVHLIRGRDVRNGVAVSHMWMDARWIFVAKLLFVLESHIFHFHESTGR